MKAVLRAIEEAFFARRGLEICATKQKGKGTSPAVIDGAGPYGSLYSPARDDRGRRIR